MKLPTELNTVTIMIIVALGATGYLVSAGLTLSASIVLFGLVPMWRLGIFARLATTTFAYGIIGAVLLQLATLVGLKLNFDLYHFVMLAAAAWYAYARRRDINFRTSVNDVVGLLVAAAVFLVVALPLLGASMSKTMEYMTPGEDNHSHFQMYRYVLTERRYAYNNSPDEAAIRPTLISYAQGSHGALAVVTAPFVDGPSRASELKVYSLAVAVTFAMLFWFAFLLVAHPLARIRNLYMRIGLSLVAGTLFVVNVPLGILLNLYSYGYLPQYFAYLSLTLLLLVVMMAVENKTVRRRVLLVEALAILLAIYAVFSSWYLLAPLAALPVLAYLWVRHRELWAEKWSIAAIAVPFLLVLAHLTYVFLFKSSGASHVLTTGGVERMNQWVLLVCLPAVVIGYLQIRARQWFLLSLTGCLLFAGAMTALIGFYQVRKIGHHDYYFYKTLFSVLYIAIVYYGYLWLKWLAAQVSGVVLPKGAGVRMLAISIGLVAACVVLLTFNLPKYLNFFLTRTYQSLQVTPDRPLDIFTYPGIYDRYSDLVTINNCNPYTNFTGTIWAGTYFLPYDVERQHLESKVVHSAVERIGQPDSILLNAIAKYAGKKSKPVAVVVSDKCTDPQLIKQQLVGANVRVILPDSSPVR